MSGNDQIAGQFAELDVTSVNVYRFAVRLGRFSRSAIEEHLGLSPQEVDRVAQVLTALRLLHPMPGAPETLVPIGPDVAASELLGPTENQIRELQFAISEARSRLMALAPSYYEDRRERNRKEAFDTISDVTVVQTVLDEHMKRCTREMLTVQPGGARPPQLLTAVQGPIFDALERGVSVRTVYQHPARTDLATRAYVAHATSLGASVRTTDEVISRMIIYDREVAFLPERVTDNRAPGAIVVREPTLIAYLCDVLEHLWATATPFHPSAEGVNSINEDIKQSIIRLLSKGYKDEMVARRLGMSVRTCRRHISEIMERLETTSRFQTGVEVTKSGLLDSDSPD